VIAEVNQGGDMVERTLRTVDQNIPIKTIHASRGKIVRAEPIAALFEQRRVSHVGLFSQLEDQMCSFVPGAKDGSHDDRVDALCYALSEVMGIERTSHSGLLEYYRLQAQAVNGGPSPAYPPAPSVASPSFYPVPGKPAPEPMLRFRAPGDVSTLYTVTGRMINLGADRLVEVNAEEAAPLKLAGWQQVQLDPV
jgi:hypothetical protein